MCNYIIRILYVTDSCTCHFKILQTTRLSLLHTHSLAAFVSEDIKCYHSFIVLVCTLFDCIYSHALYWYMHYLYITIFTCTPLVYTLYNILSSMLSCCTSYIPLLRIQGFLYVFKNALIKWFCFVLSIVDVCPIFFVSLSLSWLHYSLLWHKGQHSIYSFSLHRLCSLTFFYVDICYIDYPNFVVETKFFWKRKYFKQLDITWKLNILRRILCRRHFHGYHVGFDDK